MNGAGWHRLRSRFETGFRTSSFCDATKNTDMSDFDKYIRQSEPDSREKAQAWQTAIGLQDVDGLKPSEYLL